MKNLTLLLGVIVYLAFAKANTAQAQQQFKGVAYYTSQTKFDIKKDTATAKEISPERAEIRDKIREALKKGNTANFQLEFSQTESMYDKVEELDAPKPSDGVSISFSSNGAASSTIYKDLTKQQMLKKDQIFGKEFLIKDDIKRYEWQLTQETKKIGNYTCFKATYLPVLTEEQQKAKEKRKEEAKNGSLFAQIKESDPTIEVWYTPEIAVSNGPGDYHGLPGLILEVKERNTILLCTKIEINPDREVKIKKPRGGKTIDQESFNKLQKEKTEERMKMTGGKGYIVQEIRTSN